MATVCLGEYTLEADSPIQYVLADAIGEELQKLLPEYLVVTLINPDGDRRASRNSTNIMVALRTPTQDENNLASLAHICNFKVNEDGFTVIHGVSYLARQWYWLVTSRNTALDECLGRPISVTTPPPPEIPRSVEAGRLYFSDPNLLEQMVKHAHAAQRTAIIQLHQVAEQMYERVQAAAQQAARAAEARATEDDGWDDEG